MSASTQLLIVSLVLYFFSILVAFLLRFALRKYKGKSFAIPYDRLPIGIALVLLATTAGVLATGNKEAANDLAIMAYYLLVLGVVLQIINYIREQRARNPGEGIKGNRDRNEDHLGSGGKNSESRGKGEDHPVQDK